MTNKLLLLEETYTDPTDFIDVTPMTPEEIEAENAKEQERKNLEAKYSKLPAGVAAIVRAFNAPSTTDSDRAIFLQKLVKNDAAFETIKRIAKELGKTL